MKVFILQGLPGSGKSSFVKAHMRAVMAANDGKCEDETFSADDFFMVDGNYVFDPKKLSEAHAQCRRDFYGFVGPGEHHARLAGIDVFVFVDNTATTVAEVAPYYEFATAYGHDVEILYFPCTPEVAAARNTHGVSLDTCKAMAARLEKFESQMSPWWRRRTIDNNQQGVA